MVKNPVVGSLYGSGFGYAGDYINEDILLRKPMHLTEWGALAGGLGRRGLGRGIARGSGRTDSVGGIHAGNGPMLQPGGSLDLNLRRDPNDAALMVSEGEL